MAKAIIVIDAHSTLKVGIAGGYHAFQPEFQHLCSWCRIVFFFYHNTSLKTNNIFV